MNKQVGRFRLIVFEDYGGCEIEQTHGNGSDEVIATFIQLRADSLQDLQYVVNRAVAENARIENKNA